MRKDYMKNCQLAEEELRAAFNKMDKDERAVSIRMALRKLCRGV